VGEKVRLRPYRPEDAEDLLASMQNPESMRLTGTQGRFSFEQIQAWCAKVATAEGRVDLVIESPGADEYLGEVVLNDIDEDNLSANFRISLAAERHFGKGYGSEAARLLIDYGFRTLSLHRIHLEVFEFNPRAIRTYEKLGFRAEGRLREVLNLDGRWYDAIPMGLLRRDFLGDTD
jgi:RimJ/RimL family protein N-acetyltransferase